MYRGALRRAQIRQGSSRWVAALVGPSSPSHFQQGATSEGGFDAAEKGWLFDRRRLDRHGLDLLAVVNYWLSLLSSLRSILGFTGARETFFDVRARRLLALSWVAGL